MELNQIYSSSKLKRKPLSDCSNTRHNLQNPNSFNSNNNAVLLSSDCTAAAATRPVTRSSSKLIPKTLSKIPKIPSGFDPVISGKKRKKGNPPTSLSSVGDIFYRKSGTLTIGRNPQTGSDKGKSVKTTPIVQASTYSKLSWSVSDNGDLISKPVTTENPDLDEQRRKNKGKMVIETPIIHISSPVTSQMLETSASASSGNFYLPGPSAAHSHKQDAQLTQVKKDNLPIVQEKSNVDAFGPVTPSPLLPSSAFGADGQKKTGLMVNNQRRTSQRKKIGAGSISLPYSCPAAKRTKKKGVELDDGGGAGHPGSLTDPLPLRNKKQARNKKGSTPVMSQDELEKLKAYYADIDAFQLEEEEVGELSE